MAVRIDQEQMEEGVVAEEVIEIVVLLIDTKYQLMLMVEEVDSSRWVNFVVDLRYVMSSFKGCV